MATPKETLSSEDAIFRNDNDSAATVFVGDAPLDEKKGSINNTGDWSLRPRVQEIHDKELEAGSKGRELVVTWKDLTVEAISSDAAVNENVLSQFNIPKLVKEARHKPPLKTILDKTHGCVKPGEMLLVLGRPGAGCTTLLKMLSNHRGGYASVNGEERWDVKMD
jgi:ABC-type glutathione transport system ATPase component